MADILSQAEIDALLNVIDDGPAQDLGSENFERLYNEYHEWRSTLEKGHSPQRFGINPEEILEGLEADNQEYLQSIKNYEEFQKFHKKFKIIADKEPEIFI